MICFYISMAILYLQNLYLNLYNFESETNNLICLNIIGYIDGKYKTLCARSMEK